VSIADLSSARAELAAVCVTARAFSSAAGLPDLLDRILATIDRDLAERVASLEAEATRKREARKCPRTVRGQDSLSLSLSFNLKDQREESAPVPSADKTPEIAGAPPPSRPSTSNPLAGGGSEEPAISLADPLTDELRSIALSANVADPQRCWLKFVARNAGKRRPMPAAWLEWCARELPPRAQSPPQSETRLRAAPPSVAVERENDQAHAEYRRQAVPLPPEWRRAIGAPIKCLAETGPHRATG
jgi:hypothetical protein